MVQGKGPFSKKALASSYNQAGDIITKRITYSTVYGGTALSGAPIGISSSGAKASGVEWASYAARYQAYRVKAMRLTFIANINTSDVGAWTNGCLFIGDTLVSNAPSTIQQILSDERSEVHPTTSSFKFSASWLRNPNAKLWNATSAAIPAANQFQIVFASPDALTNVQYYDVIAEWEVEFRGSQ